MLDGTFQSTCDPVSFYFPHNSNDKQNNETVALITSDGIKFQSIVTPDGLVAYFLAPISDIAKIAS